MSRRRFEVFEYRQVLARMRQSDSDRDIASPRLMGRGKLKTVRQVALARGWLDPGRPLPDDAELAAIVGRNLKLPRSCVSTIEPADGGAARQRDRLRARAAELGGWPAHAHDGLRRGPADDAGLGVWFCRRAGRENVVLDPSRVAAIGFLGAGSILLRGEAVRGLTTAASLWSIAGIGLAVGGGM